METLQRLLPSAPPDIFDVYARYDPERIEAALEASRNAPGLFTVDEIRAMCGHSPLPDGAGNRPHHPTAVTR